VWIVVGVIAVIVAAVVAAVVFVRSGTGQRYLLGMAEQKASSALGTQVQAQNFSISFSGLSPTIDLYGVVVSGAPPYSNVPLLSVDHIRVAVRVTSLIHRSWYLNEIRIDHPVANISVDRNGNDNLPHTQNKSQSNTSVFDLGIRHALLDRGEIYYNSRKSMLNADLHELLLQFVFATASRQYSGNLSYSDGHLHMGDYAPIPHALTAEFVASPTTFTLRRALLTSGPSRILLSATLQDYSQPKLTGTYDAVLDTSEFGRIMKNATLPVGVVRLTGTIKYVSEPNVPMLDTLNLAGDLASRALRVSTSGFTGDVRDVAARYSINHGNLDVLDLRAYILGGKLTGTLAMRNITGATRSQLHAVVRGVSLADLKPLANSSSLQQVSPTGTANATADARWGKSFSDLVANVSADLSGAVGSATGTGSVPVTGAIVARYAAKTQQISLSKSYIRLPQTSLTLDGTVSQRSSLHVSVQSANLHELETIADMFSTAKPGSTPQSIGIYGSASFVGTVRGSTAAPQIAGQLNAANLRVRGTNWRQLRTAVNLSSSQASLQNGYLQPADRGRITFNVALGLHHWSFTNTSPVRANVNASQLNVAALTKAAGIQTSLAGLASADLSFQGSELRPDGQGTIRLTNANVAGQPIRSVNVAFRGTGQAVNANMNVAIPAAGTATATVTYFPAQQGYNLSLTANGIRLGQLAAVKQRNLQLTGVLNLNASGHGTIQNPQLNAAAQVPQLDIRGQTISGLILQAAVANHVANVALDSEVVNTFVRAHGTVDLTGNYETNAVLDTQVIPLAPLVAAYAPSQAGDITGQTEVHATLRGPLKDMALLQAHVTIPVLSLKYKNAIQLAAVAPIKLDYANGVAQLQRATIRGTDTDLQLQGTIPVKSTAPARLLLLGTVDLKLTQLLYPGVTTSGQLRFDINSYGTTAAPNVEGQVRIVNASFATGTMPIGMQNGNGVLSLTRDRVNITQFEGTVGGGKVTASGGVVYRPSLQVDLAFAGNGIRMLYPQGVREGFDANLALTGTMQSASLSGQVQLDQLTLTPDFDLTTFLQQFGGVAPAPPPQGFSDNLQLDVGLTSTGGLNLVSSDFSIRANANLRIRGTAADPVVTGRANVNGGDIIFMGKRYVLQQGTIDFANPAQTQAILNVSATTTIDQYNINMRFEGPLDRLRTNYSSDPALPPADIINLLAFGKTREAQAANPTPGTLAAESTVASQVSGQVTSRIQKLVGISQLSVDPLLGCNQENRGACISIQQRVTSKIFVTFVTDVTALQRETIQLEYQKSPRLSFSGTRDQNGGFGVDTTIHKSW
jgi:translocation and assembly module TamB